ncbi:MAG TPA: helix-turn-helix transcriptional regulator [Pirellulales bacterium]
MPRGHVLPEGKTVSTLRGEAGLTQDELAERSGYGLRTISNIESGRRTTAPTLAAVATVLGDCLRRPVEMTDLLRREREGVNTGQALDGQLIVGENIKLLDLAISSQHTDSKRGEGPPSQAVLIDTLCVRHLPDSLTEINFYYATAGGVVAGSSLSHPQSAQWLSPSEAAGAHAFAMDDHYQVLRVSVTSPRRQAQPLLQNRVEYADGFTHPQEKWLDAHVAYPTDCLTLLVRLPDDQPYQSLRGLCRRRVAGPWMPTADTPIGIQAGRMVYWRITTPLPGETYHLGWT